MLESIGNRIPETAELYHSLVGCNVLSACDMKDGYWNVGLDEESMRLTAFCSEAGSWCWRCLPQGMVSSGPYFQTWMERLLRRHNMLAGRAHYRYS